MKKTNLTAKIATSLVLCFMTVLTAYAGFSKTNTYAEGTFTDVKADAWYAKEVASAYELGFMNGTGGGKFSPDGNVTVAESITMASRVHASYNGKDIAQKQGAKNWYDMYVDYAVANGLIKADQFDNYARNAMRYEVAVMFENAMPENYFNTQNKVKYIPDVAETEEYYDELLTLYKAGVVMGSDDYGNFYAENSIKRSETAAIINRVALPENRLSKNLIEESDKMAVYLINDLGLQNKYSGKEYIASGWTYENPDSTNRTKIDYSTYSLRDVSSESGITLRKDIETQTSGAITFETIITASGGGYALRFESADEKPVFILSHKGTKLYAQGKTEVDTGYEVSDSALRVYLILNLDSGKTTVCINGNTLGDFEMSDVKEISRVVFATGKEEKVNMTPHEVHMYVNYAVNDTFNINSAGTVPYGWTFSENTAIAEVNSGNADVNSIKITNKGEASKKFTPVSGKFVYETYVKSPSGQDVVLALRNDGKNAVMVSAKDGKFTSEGKKVRNYNQNLWHLVRIEGDTESGTALVRIDGKPDGTTVALSETAIDEVVLSASGTGEAIFDDIQVYNIYDFDDYVPEPVPVTDDGRYLGMSICSLWREGSHYGWDCISPYDEITPVLGYYDEGLPEVADWEIKFMVEHGYDFQHFCWYYAANNFSDGIKKPNLGSALHDGYMNAKYSNMQKFSIMWENYTSGVTPEIFYNEIWPYWCEWYFSDPRYMSVDNLAVLSLYVPEKFIEHMGGIEGAKEAINFMRKDIKKLGYDGMIILATSSGTNVKESTNAAEIGIDAFIAYHFGTSAYRSEYQIERMTAAYDADIIPFLPSVGVGLNGIGWTEKREPYATAEEHKKVFEWAVDEYLPKLAQREGKEWIGKLAIANTWNEFGEGHYISPTNVNKFGFLDAARAEFSAVSGQDDSAHVDVEPTAKQKARLGTLYQGNRIPMRRTMFVNDDASIGNNIPVKTWDFENAEVCNLWTRLANVASVGYDAEEKALYGETTTNDGHIVNLNVEENFVNADDARYMHIVMKTEGGFGTDIQFYFDDKYSTAWNGAKGAGIALKSDGEYHDYYIDLSTKELWTGTVKIIRFDPLGEIGKFWIKKIEFLSDEMEGGYNVEVDALKYVFSPTFAKKVGDEMFVAGNPSEGFYSLNDFYYEWNRLDGKLLIRAKTGTEFNFTVGSDKVLVDGVEKTIASKIELVDGLVMLPIKFIYDNAGYEYDEEGNTIKAYVSGRKYAEALKSRRLFEYEFNIPDDTEGWRIGEATGGVYNDGLLLLESKPIGTIYDPKIVRDKMNLSANTYKQAVIRFMADYADEAESQTLQIFFATSTNTAIDEKKSIRVDMSELAPDEYGFYKFTVDFSKNEAWNGNVTMLRIDPPNRAGKFYIDYIKFEEGDPTKVITDEATELNIDELETVATFKFDDADKFRTGNVLNIEYGNIMKGVSSTNDPTVVYKDKLDIDINNVTAIKINAKLPKGTGLEIFFGTSSFPSFNADRRFTLIASSSEMTTYIIDTTGNPFWGGTLTDLRLDPVTGAGQPFEYVSLEFCEGGVVEKELDLSRLTTVDTLKFDDADKFRVGNITDVEFGKSLKGTSKTNDPTVVLTEKMDVAIDDVTYIKVNTKLPKGTSVELFFATAESPGYSENKKFVFKATSSEKTTYIIDAQSNPQWKGTLTEIRLDPVTSPDLYFEYESLEFCTGEIE